MQLDKTQEMIIVFPNGSNMLGGTLFLSSPANGDIKTYLTEELVEYVDSHYRTLPQRESRGIAGCSMGGDGAAQLGIQVSERLLRTAVAQSGLYFFDRDRALEAGLKEFTKEPTSIEEFRTAACDCPESSCRGGSGGAERKQAALVFRYALRNR